MMIMMMHSMQSIIIAAVCMTLLTQHTALAALSTPQSLSSSHLSPHLSTQAEAEAEGAEMGRVAFLVRASPVLARELVRTYVPAAEVLLSAALHSMGASFFNQEQAEDEEEAEISNPYASRYTQFVQDRSSKGSLSDAERLLKHGYDKYRYVSQEFLDRHPLQTKEPEPGRIKAFSKMFQPMYIKSAWREDALSDSSMRSPWTTTTATATPKASARAAAGTPSVQRTVKPTAGRLNTTFRILRSREASRKRSSSKG